MPRFADLQSDVECSGELLNMLEEGLDAVRDQLGACEDGKTGAVRAHAAREAKLAERVEYLRGRVLGLVRACECAAQRGHECTRSAAHSMLVHRRVHEGVAEAVHVLTVVSQLVAWWRGEDVDGTHTADAPHARARHGRRRRRRRRERASHGSGSGSDGTEDVRASLSFVGGAAYCEQQAHERMDALLHRVDTLRVMVGGEGECAAWVCPSLVELCVQCVGTEMMRGDRMAMAAAAEATGAVVPHPLWADVLERVYARDGLNGRVMRELVAGDGLLVVGMRGCMWARDSWLTHVGAGACTTVVDVRGCERLSGAGLAKLQPLGDQLQELRAGPVAVEHVRQISFLAKCPHLHTLVLQGLTIGRGGPLTMRAPSLRVLDVHGAEARHGQVKLAKLLSLRKQPATLRTLDMGSGQVVAWADTWGEWACGAAVEVLRCAGLHMEPFLDLSTWRALRRVNLSRSWASPAAAHVVLELPHIEWLGLFCPRAMCTDDVLDLHDAATEEGVVLSSRHSATWGEWMTLVHEARHDDYLADVLLAMESHAPLWDAWEPSDGPLDALTELLECPFTSEDVLAGTCAVLQILAQCDDTGALINKHVLDTMVALMRRHVRSTAVVEGVCHLLCVVLERHVVPLERADAARYAPLLCEVMRLYYADAHMTSWACHALLTLAGEHAEEVRHHVLELIRAGVTAPWVHHLLASAYGDDESSTTEEVVRLLWACCSAEGKQVLHEADVILPALLRTLRWSCSRVATRASGLRQACLGCWACLCHNDGQSAAYLASANALPLLLQALCTSYTTDSLALSTQYAACCVDAIMDVLHDTEHAPAGVSLGAVWKHMLDSLHSHTFALAPRIMRAVDALLSSNSSTTTSGGIPVVKLGKRVCVSLVALLRRAGEGGDGSLWEEDYWYAPVITAISQLARESPLDRVLVEEGAHEQLFSFLTEPTEIYQALVALRNLTADVEPAAAAVCTSTGVFPILLHTVTAPSVPDILAHSAAAVLMNSTALAPEAARTWLPELLKNTRSLQHSPADRSGQRIRALVLCAYNTLNGEDTPDELRADAQRAAEELLACGCDACAAQHAVAQLLVRRPGAAE